MLMDFSEAHTRLKAMNGKVAMKNVNPNQF